MMQPISGPASGTSIEERVERDFFRARRRETVGRLRRRLGAWLERCCSAGRPGAWAACLSAKPAVAGTRARVSLGSQEVELFRIVGSVGRCREFDQDFLPIKRSLETRWKSVARALLEGKILPSVKLYKVGERYFVEDGNHRVSVARYQGMPMIDAEVTELLPADVRTPEDSSVNPLDSANNH